MGGSVVADAVLLARFLCEDQSLTDSQLDGLRNAELDQNADGFLTLLDVKAILKKLTIV